MKDATRLLFDAAAADEFPKDEECLRTFLFDRTTDWSSLLGLYIGKSHSDMSPRVFSHECWGTA